ncbi:hypothetical protein EW146_g7060 [Bondarzewia mesenterica]|uniref:Uncharacterized protein n=1 Tax=Bondarzewia mesenterica TaxID=1095465 RepID=A0A4S4LNR6_9AGAM|nr:hypothetical protein EW146_g7060 [Bondarzewia mesenterica]
MPAKYSHVKKRSAAARKTSKDGNGPHPHPHGNAHGNPHAHSYKDHRAPNPLVDKSISQAMTAVSQLELCIARMLLLRYEQDIARLFSTRLFSVSLVHLPTLMMRCISIYGPGWVAFNADSNEIKDFFSCRYRDGHAPGGRAGRYEECAMAMSNGVPICRKRGLHSLRLLPHYPALKSHLDALESAQQPKFSKPTHLGPLTEGFDALEEACMLKYGARITTGGGAWDANWRAKVRIGYERLVQTLWRIAHEFDVRGYGLVLREKLTSKWCECGCSTDHLGEVCERTVSEEELESGVRSGKQREWDGRGSGVYGWGTDEEEDVWEVELDFGGDEPPGQGDPEMTIGELMEWRYVKAEREKEQGNAAFKKADYESAIKFYIAANEIEPEMPHYQLNLAAAHLKLNQWMEAEAACDKALSQHKSGKGYFRRARARRMQGHVEDAIKDLRAALQIQPNNAEALTELASLIPPSNGDPASVKSLNPSSSSSSSAPQPPTYEYLHLPKPKPPKPLPFARTERDTKKLKITPTPLTLDMPVDLARAEAFMAALSEKDKVRDVMEMPDMEVRAESFAYPGWERYTIRRCE